MIIAHRGASGYEPEHTMKSYELALEQGADYIEQDINMTKDGHLICMHDNSVDRTTNGTGKIKDLTLSEIKQLDAGDGQEVPTLDEVITHFGNSIKYYIETKRPFNPDMDKELMRVLLKHNLIGMGSKKKQVIIQSFSEESLINIRSHYSDVMLVRLKSKPSISELKDFKEYAQVVSPRHDNINKEFVDEAHDLGLLVHPYTVNDFEDMLDVLEKGVDGFFTNYPDRGIYAMHET